MKPYEILCEAISHHYGVKVSTSEPEKLKMWIYRERKNARNAGVTDFDDISIFHIDESTLFVSNFSALEQWYESQEM